MFFIIQVNFNCGLGLHKKSVQERNGNCKFRHACALDQKSAASYCKQRSIYSGPENEEKRGRLRETSPLTAEIGQLALIFNDLAGPCAQANHFNLSLR